MNGADVEWQGRGLVPGTVKAEAIVARTRLSFWGGFDPRTGVIVERDSPLRGVEVAGRVLIFVSTKGSSGTSGMLSIAARAGLAPAAFVNAEVDAMAVLACVVNEIPMVVDVDVGIFEQLVTGDVVEIDGERGCVRLIERSTDRREATDDAG